MSKNNLVRGKHPQTASLRNVLATQGVVAPHNGKPFSEAMLLGIGGGLGAGYILWESEREESAIIVLGFRNRWNYATQHLTTMSERISAKVTVQESSGAKAAAANLQAAVDSGVPFIAWVDKGHLPYQCLPESIKGYASHLVGVHGMNPDQSVLLDDVADHLFTVDPDSFAAGRGRIGSDKNRIMRIEASTKIDLKTAIVEGIQDCIEYLGSNSELFALPVYKKWAKLMTDTKNKKGWPVVFKERKGLYNTMRSIFEGVTLDGTEGCGLRGMYAEFLDEAAPVIGKPGLKTVAEQYRDLATLWTQFAEAALPDSVPVLNQTKTLMRKRYELYHMNRLDELRPVSDQLLSLQLELNRAFPMDYKDVDVLFAALQEKLSAIYEAEVQALAALQTAME